MAVATKSHPQMGGLPHVAENFEIELLEARARDATRPISHGCHTHPQTPVGNGPGEVQWHTDVNHARVVIELMGLDVKTSKPAPTPGTKYGPGEPDSAGGQLRNSEDEVEDGDWKADGSAPGTLLYHASERPDIQFSTGRCMSGLSRLKVKYLALLMHIARCPPSSLHLPPTSLAKRLSLFSQIIFCMK